MRHGCFLLCAAAGCFAPDPQAGVPCSADQTCPDGQFCVAHDGVQTCELDPDAFPPPPPPPPAERDSDGDGVIDDIDNCPELANPDQADEERDRVGDACDPCPIADDNADADADGLGDACDPNPTTPGDTLVSFAGFADGLPPGWTASGLFNAGGGEGVAMAGDTASALVTFPSPASERVEIRAAATAVAITANGQNLGAVNVVEQLAPGTDKAVACQLSRLSDGSQQQLRIFNTSTSEIVNTGGHPFGVPGELELRLRRNGTQYLCHATSPALELGGTAALAPQDPRIGLRVRGAIATYHWVMIVASP